MIRLALLVLIFLCASAQAQNQGNGIQQGGAITAGHAGAWRANGVLGDAGASAAPTLANQGSIFGGFNVTNGGICTQDGYNSLTLSPQGYHQLCLFANSLGGGLISYNAYNGASQLGLNLNLNGTTYPLPSPGNGNVLGPVSSTAGDIACFNNASGTLLKDCAPLIGAVPAVVMTQTGGNWAITGPNGATVSSSTSACQMVQDGINYAQAHSNPLLVFGAGKTAAGGRNGVIFCNQTLAFPTGWTNHYEFYGVTLVYGTSYASCGNVNNDFITFDSMDSTNVDFHNSEIDYCGNKAAVHFLPQNDNGESLSGFSSSHVNLGVIALVDNPGTIQHSRGIGVQISTPALGGGLSFGCGLAENMNFEVQEVNGGLFGIRIDDPGGTNGAPCPPSIFLNNIINAKAVHSNGTGIGVGQTTAASPLIGGNHWGPVTMSSVGTNINTYATGDIYQYTIGGGTFGVVQQSTANNNTYIEASNLAGTTFTNNCSGSACLGGIRLSNQGGSTRTATGLSSSPFVYQNTTLRDVSILVSGPATYTFGVSVDGASYDTWNAASNNVTTFMLKPGMFAKVTYASTAPVFFTYY